MPPLTASVPAGKGAQRVLMPPLEFGSVVPHVEVPEHSVITSK